MLIWFFKKEEIISQINEGKNTLNSRTLVEIYVAIVSLLDLSSIASEVPATIPAIKAIIQWINELMNSFINEKKEKITIPVIFFISNLSKKTIDSFIATYKNW